MPSFAAVNPQLISLQVVTLLQRYCFPYPNQGMKDTGFHVLQIVNPPLLAM